MKGDQEMLDSFDLSMQDLAESFPKDVTEEGDTYLFNLASIVIKLVGLAKSQGMTEAEFMGRVQGLWDDIEAEVVVNKGELN